MAEKVPIPNGVPISKEQYAIYQNAARDVQEANSRLQLCLASILAGHGITDAGVLAVTPEGIELATPSSEDDGPEQAEPATSSAGS